MKVSQEKKGELQICQNLLNIFDGAFDWQVWFLCLSLLHVNLRAPAPALQPSAWQLGAGVGPSYEQTVGWSGGKTPRGACPQKWPQKPPVSWEHPRKRRGEMLIDSRRCQCGLVSGAVCTQVCVCVCPGQPWIRQHFCVWQWLPCTSASRSRSRWVSVLFQPFEFGSIIFVTFSHTAHTVGLHRLLSTSFIPVQSRQRRLVRRKLKDKKKII